MFWFFLSLTAALTQALNDVISKKFFSGITSYEMGLIRLLYALPWLAGAFFIIDRPPLDLVFWLCVAAGLPLEVIALVCYMKAIKTSPLSITIPFLAFTPAFMILSGAVILGERLSSPGLAGIWLIVVGTYVLKLPGTRDKLSDPLIAVFKKKGPRLMLMVAFIYSVTSTLAKLAIEHSSPSFFAVIYFLLCAFMTAILFPFIPGVRPANIYARPCAGVISGTVLASMIFSHTLAISLVEAAYMISVKRSSILFGVLFGSLIFKEESFRERFAGASIMMAGVLIIGLFG